MCEILFNILALIIIPPITALVAVWVSQKLQDRAKKREDKMDILKTFTSHIAELERIMEKEMSKEASRDWARADNLVPIVFSDSKKVITKWIEYRNALPKEDRDRFKYAMKDFDKNKRDKKITTYQNSLYDFVESMLDDVGYKNILPYERKKSQTKQ